MMIDRSVTETQMMRYFDSRLVDFELCQNYFDNHLTMKAATARKFEVLIIIRSTRETYMNSY